MTVDLHDAHRLAALARLEATCLRVDVSEGHCMTVWRHWGQGPALVLLHGGSGSWTQWVRNIEALAASHTVLVPDMPGYGDSAELPAGATEETMAEVLAQALDTVLPSDEPVDLIAFSFGCLVASQIATLRPWRVGKLVLVGAVGLGIKRVGQRPMQNWRSETDPTRLRAIHRHNVASLMIHDESAVDELAVELQLRNAARSRHYSKRSSHGDALLRSLPIVDAPVFGIWGGADVTASGRVPDLGPLLQSLSPSAQFLVIQGAGHWVQYEKSEEFNNALAMLLAE